jgi:hypothetical protein
LKQWDDQNIIMHENHLRRANLSLQETILSLIQLPMIGSRTAETYHRPDMAEALAGL